LKQLFTTSSIKELAISVDQLLRGDPGETKPRDNAFVLKSNSLGDLPSPSSSGEASALLFSIRWRRGICI
jgi:hypothetical protein